MLSKSTTQCIYYHLWLTWIVGIAYSQRHKLAAVLDASLSILQAMFDSSHTSRMVGNDDFGDVVVTNMLNVTKMAVFLR